MQARWHSVGGAVLLLMALTGCGEGNHGGGSLFERTAAVPATSTGTGTGAGSGMEAGSGSGTGSATSTAMAGQAAPAPASVGALFAQVQTMVNSHSETAAPLALGNMTLPTDDSAPPAPVR